MIILGGNFRQVLPIVPHVSRPSNNATAQNSTKFFTVTLQSSQTHQKYESKG